MCTLEHSLNKNELAFNYVGIVYECFEFSKRQKARLDFFLNVKSQRNIVLYVSVHSDHKMTSSVVNS